VVEDLVIRAKTYRVMYHHTILLHGPRGLADYVDNLDLLGHGSSNAIQGTQLTNTMCGDN